jgi:putative addiction module component (TIGR02574 family)
MTLDILQLSIAERIQLVEDIWDSIATAPEALPMSQAQRDELDRRLQAYALRPAEGKTWQQVLEALKQRRQP